MLLQLTEQVKELKDKVTKLEGGQAVCKNCQSKVEEITKESKEIKDSKESMNNMWVTDINSNIGHMKPKSVFQSIFNTKSEQINTDKKSRPKRQGRQTTGLKGLELNLSANKNLSRSIGNDGGNKNLSQNKSITTDEKSPVNDRTQSLIKECSANKETRRFTNDPKIDLRLYEEEQNNSKFKPNTKRSEERKSNLEDGSVEYEYEYETVIMEDQKSST